ncbi:MAG: hypothetical protein J1F43_06395 [Muribaculaceae bacterium]|nr:hypothetical protein [Muribaculaceae bacterium]
MSRLPFDINDDEIRIISSERKGPDIGKTHRNPKLLDEENDKENLPEDSEKCLECGELLKYDDELRENKLIKRAFMPQSTFDQRDKPKWKVWVIITAVILFGAICVFFWWEVKEDTESVENSVFESENFSENEEGIVIKDTVDLPVQTAIMSEKGYVSTYDTVINKVPLTIFNPRNLVPKLHIGTDALKDSTAGFVVQAADIRRDNGQIVGQYVSEGNLLSRGQSKAGFCAIINGKIIIGVADSTPYLEQAIESGGYFFRQYPLVVGGQVVENRLKSSSLRKALAELNGETVVIMSDREQTLMEFSKTLVDLGVTNAIYLIGSTAPGFAIDKEGRRIEFGKAYANPSIKSNYIIWE